LFALVRLDLVPEDGDHHVGIQTEPDGPGGDVIEDPLLAGGIVDRPVGAVPGGGHLVGDQQSLGEQVRQRGESPSGRRSGRRGPRLGDGRHHAAEPDSSSAAQAAPNTDRFRRILTGRVLPMGV
jgi:hypothetical protein